MNKATKSIVVAAFGNSADAQAAAQDLQAAGINQEDIQLVSSSSDTATTGYPASDYGSRTAHHEGGITGWFKSLFGAEDNADRAGYERAYNQGTYLLSVDASESQIEGIEDILNRHSLIDVHTDDAYASGSTSTTATTGTTRVNTGANTTEAVPVVEEELQVGKRRVPRAGVRVYSRPMEQPVQESVNLQEEHVHVERRPANRPVTNADSKAGQEKVTEIEEYAEEPVAAKQARVVEEVRVGKEILQRSETEQHYWIYNKIVERAVDVFGSELKATRWLSRQNPDFGGKSPLETLVDSGFDPTPIFNTLGRIEHGVYF